MEDEWARVPQGTRNSTEAIHPKKCILLIILYHRTGMCRAIRIERWLEHGHKVRAPAQYRRARYSIDTICNGASTWNRHCLRLLIYLKYKISKYNKHGYLRHCYSREQDKGFQTIVHSTTVSRVHKLIISQLVMLERRFLAHLYGSWCSFTVAHNGQAHIYIVRNDCSPRALEDGINFACGVIESTSLEQNAETQGEYMRSEVDIELKW